MQQPDEVLELLQARGQEKSVHYTTEVLEPSTQSSQFIRFQIPAKGILQAGSKVILPLYASNATSSLSMYGGAFGLIKNITLSVNGGQIIQTSRANFLMALRESYKDMDKREKVSQFTNGSWNVWKYEQQTAPALNGKFAIKTLDPDGNRPQRHRMPSGLSANTAPEYCISLKQMFPEFDTSLPLFCMGQVELLIELADNREVCVATDGNNANIGTISVDSANTKFVSDHLYYDQDTMNRLRALTETAQGLVIPFGQYSTVELSLAGGTPVGPAIELEKTFQRTLGFNNTRIQHILICKNQDTASNNNAQKVGGVYCTAPDFAGSKSESIQLQINNINYYNTPLVNNHYARELSDVFGVMPKNSYPLMTAIGSRNTGALGTANNRNGRNNVLLSTNAVMGGAVDQTNLMASQQYIGINFAHQRINNGSNGVMVSDAPINFTYVKKFVADDTENMSMKMFVCVSRLGSIQRGNFVANY